MTVAQAMAWNDALDPDWGKKRRDDRPQNGEPVPEIKTAADLEKLLEAARAGEFVL